MEKCGKDDVPISHWKAAVSGGDEGVYGAACRNDTTKD